MHPLPFLEVQNYAYLYNILIHLRPLKYFQGIGRKRNYWALLHLSYIQGDTSEQKSLVMKKNQLFVPEYSQGNLKNLGHCGQTEATESTSGIANDILKKPESV